MIAPSPFLLNAYSLHEVHISLKTLSSDPNTVLVSAVDTDKSQLHLLGQWMIAVAVQEPEITRAFQISLRAGDNKVNEKVGMCTYVRTCVTIWLSESMAIIMHVLMTLHVV